MPLETPRERNGSYEPKIISKGQTRWIAVQLLVFRNYALTCRAGRRVWFRRGAATRWLPRDPPPEVPHIAFAWRKIAALVMFRSRDIFPVSAHAEKLALFRYGLIAPLVIETLPRGELTRCAQDFAARHYDIPYSKRTAVAVDTLLE
jgi:hypothetical protein